MRRLAVLLAFTSVLSVALPWSGAVATFPTVDIEEYRYMPRKETAPLGGVLQWHNIGSLTHSATGDAPLRFFDTGNLPPDGFSGGVEFWAAGRFAYHCRIHPGLMRGVMRVPVTASSPGIGLGESVTITVSSDPLFKGVTFDLQRRRNQGDWIVIETGIGVDGVGVTPKRTGTFRFRARVVDLDDHASGWSPAATVIVGDV